ncbi:TPA: structural protein [Pseudomonas aeruginosa]|uniref:structural protein n=1 Tax=Pseudomonas aeruginosa TaxID=287 RepID=UPI00053DD4C3|nr:structural protein [Pseudomonas aeruginosa]EIU5460362.1 structural protein [Pseudomonas aeruginosa]EIU5543745.1 structural protein [Pseudomonas aeruginosa]EKW4494335.1 structural protein [Pseudomonas aeruginosa]EKY0078168.1 structural protein [Pseudomonas aeruginosa]EKY0500349.1 structural protein [Pseudomonas aeruginosa]
MTTPRGIRNNNPGNIDYNPRNDWRGQLPHDPAIEKRFARFDTPENGIRALGKLLQTYQRKHGLNTVEQIISRWAPASENDTAAYVRSVEARTGTPPGARVNMADTKTLRGFVEAIIHHENGGIPYSDMVIRTGVFLALSP